MSHTHTKLLFHCVFSTKDRRGFLKGDISDRVNAYMAGIAKNNDMWLVRAGGIEDNRHLILELKPNMCVSDALGKIKGSSSKWVSDTFPQLEVFNWQIGYSAFTVSPSALPKVVAYVENQKEHHRKMTFKEELIMLLERHGIDFDKDKIFD